MKTLILIPTAIAFAFTLGTSAHARIAADGVYSIEQMADSSVDKRRKPRVKGGSGCDTPMDIIQHPECR